MNEAKAVRVFCEITGAEACFRRLDFATDFITYDVIPPLHVRHLLAACWSVDPRWQMKKIIVVNPIVNRWREIDTTTGPKRMLSLVDVAYVVEASLPKQQADRLRALGTTRASYLGLRGLDGIVKLSFDETERSYPAAVPDRELGWLPYDLNGERKARMRHMRAYLSGGAIDTSNVCADDLAA